MRDMDLTKQTSKQAHCIEAEAELLKIGNSSLFLLPFAERDENFVIEFTTLVRIVRSY